MRLASFGAACGAIALLLSACASFSPDAGMEAVNAITSPELGTGAVKIDNEEAADEARARTRHLLASRLTARGAVQLALLNNKGLQAAYNELGISEAALVEASLPPAPRLALSRISTPVELDIEGRIVADILALATLPARARIAADRFRQAQLRAAEETLRVGAEARRSYYRAVAALQIAASLAQAVDAADSAAKLAKQLAQTGAMNKLDVAREDTFHAELTAQLEAARQRAQSERERLVRALGVGGDDMRFRLPNALPPLPKRARRAADVEAEAVRRRVDLRIARIEVQALAKSYGLTNATRFINLLDVAGVVRTQQDASGAGGTGGGAEIEFQVPIFDFGEVRLRKAVETYMGAVNRLTEKAVNVRSQAREAYGAYRSAFVIADRYRNTILPLRKTISDEMTLRYGAMQVDVFALLTEARQRLAANIAAIEGQRDFWVALVDLDAAIAGGGSGDDATIPRASDRTGRSTAE